MKAFPAVIALLLVQVACGQQVVPLSPLMARMEGLEQGTAVADTRIYLTANHDPIPAEFDLAQPTLMVQCLKRLNGKLSFEMFVNDGGVTDTAYYPPWKSTPDDKYPPETKKIAVTMEFLGYTHVKPVRRKFEYVVAPVGQLRYDSPGMGSMNLEEIAYYFQYLKALPTLRHSFPGHTMTFTTEALLAQIRKEPLCRASGL